MFIYFIFFYFQPNIPITLQQRTSDKTCPSLLHSSSQFFYFLRLMQLFPETHPATLHTVLTLCKNDFFSTVDKLLYAKRCKSLYHRSQVVVNKKCTPSRSHPYCCPNEQCKSCVHNKNKNGHKKAESSDTKSLDSSNRGYSFNVSGTEGEEKCKHNSNNPGNDSELKGLNLTINSVSKISEGEYSMNYDNV